MQPCIQGCDYFGNECPYDEAAWQFADAFCYNLLMSGFDANKHGIGKFNSAETFEESINAKFGLTPEDE